MGDSNNITLGPGKLHIAPLGSTLPTDLATALDAAFQEIGYTEDGSEVAYEMTSEPVEVAEELDPVFNKVVGRSGTVVFQMVEVTARNLTIAFNGGTVTDNTTYVTYEPPDPGSEVRRILVFESEDGEERWVFRQVFQTGSVSVGRRKGAAKATLPVAMAIEKPAAGGKPFTVYMASAREGGTL